MTIKKYGLAGCGMMGTEHINNINLLDGAEIAAVFDPVQALAGAAASKATDATIMGSFEELVQLESLDAIIIASPNNLHIDQLEKIISIRNIPILCEKPLYTKLDDENRLEKLMTKASAPIWVAMEYRYMPPVKAFIERAQNITGKIEMLTIREHRFPFLEKVANWNRFNRNTGGTFVEKCCHFFDLMRLILNAEPIRVSASAGQALNHLDESYEGQTPDIWDSGFAIFDFDNGSRALLELCMFADGSLWQEEITAVGATGKVECRVPGPHRFWPEHLGEQPNAQLVSSPRMPINPAIEDIVIDPALKLAGDHHGSTFYQHQRFLKVVNGEAQTEVTLDDGRMAVKMGLAAQQAALESRVIDLRDEAAENEH